MFIRIKTTPNSPRKSVQIVENYRTQGKIKQKILRHVGIALDESEITKLKDLATDIVAKLLKERMDSGNPSPFLETTLNEWQQTLRSKVGRPPRKKLTDILPPSQVSLEDVIEEKRITEGVFEVGAIVYQQLGFSTLLKTKRDNALLQDLVLSRLTHPCSKHRTQEILTQRFNKTHDLDRIYRLLDKVYNKIPQIQSKAFVAAQQLFPEKIDFVLFDVTTLYFESTDTDEMRAFGYSKDHRFNTTQVVLALATNTEGLPLGYELFSGNTAEVSTLLVLVERWKTQFKVGSVCFVGDRAMFSEKNLQQLEAKNHQYIIAAKLRALPKIMQQKLLDEKNYHAHTVIDNELLWSSEFEHGGRRLIVSYKKQRAAKDAADRQRVVEKVQRLIGGKSGSAKKALNNQGVKKFTTLSEAATLTLDEAKVNADALWDGLHGLITNTTEDIVTLLSRYARLWVIEESFRINKHTLSMRPIFHWKPERIQAHIALCYMSFAVLRHLQYRVVLTQKISIEKILDELAHVQSSILLHKKTGDRYRLPSHFSLAAQKIYKTFDIRRDLDVAIYA